MSETIDITRLACLVAVAQQYKIKGLEKSNEDHVKKVVLAAIQASFLEMKYLGHFKSKLLVI